MTSSDPTIDGHTLRYQHRRPELLAAAAEYILEHGITDLSLRPIARGIGVSHATLLRHFGTKEALVAAVVDHIRDELFRRRREPPGDDGGASLGESMWATWRLLCRPTERRQFVLLFELVAMHARDPSRFGSLAANLISDFLDPMTVSLRAAGISGREARSFATSYLAQVRGLQLDLAVSGDRRRVDAAMRHYIAAMTQGLHGGAGDHA